MKRPVWPLYLLCILWWHNHNSTSTSGIRRAANSVKSVNLVQQGGLEWLESCERNVALFLRKCIDLVTNVTRNLRRQIFSHFHQETMHSLLLSKHDRVLAQNVHMWTNASECWHWLLCGRSEIFSVSTPYQISEVFQTRMIAQQTGRTGLMVSR